MNKVDFVRRDEIESVIATLNESAKFELELKQAETQLELSKYLQEGSNRRSECFEA